MAEFLTALACFRLCLYEDSLIVINQYYQFYRPRFTQLEEVLRRNVNSQNYFYNLMLKTDDELKKSDGFVDHILKRLKKQTPFSLDFNSIHKIDQEIIRIKKNKKKAAQDAFVGHFASVKENMINKINYNAKTDVFGFS